MTFVGFDLHKRYITACALEAGGTLVAEVRQLATTLETLLDWLAGLPAPISVGMEATLYWEWLVAHLQTAGHTAHVADASQVKLIWQARSTTDTIDARKRAASWRSCCARTCSRRSGCRISRRVTGANCSGGGRSSCASAHG
jgi:transposase